jgi:hypothetical protein
MFLLLTETYTAGMVCTDCTSHACCFLQLGNLPVKILEENVFANK